MKTPACLRPLFLLVVALFAALSAASAEPAPSAPHYTFVLVHGASGGGWDWKKIDRLLTADGHLVHRATLTGLGEKVHLASPDISLTTHVNDVVNLILYEDLHDVILVGHSYGGMVITGVMDRIPERIAHVVFLDAAAPDHGMSAVDVWGPLAPDYRVVDGLIHFPWLSPTSPAPRDEPQSLKTFTEPVSFKNPAAKRLAVTYVAFIPDGQPAESRFGDPDWKRAKARGWKMRILGSDHNAQRSHPIELVALLELAPKDQNQF